MAHIERVDILETGIYEFHKVGNLIPGPKTATGIITLAAFANLQERYQHNFRF